MEAAADEVEGQGRGGKGEKGNDCCAPGKAWRAAATLPGDENAGCDDKSAHDRRSQVQKSWPETVEANSHGIEGRVTRPVRGEGQAPAVKQKVPGADGLTLEDHCRPV